MHLNTIKLSIFHVSLTRLSVTKMSVIGMLLFYFLFSQQLLSENTLPPKISQTTPPIAKKVDHYMEIHGDKRNDPYYWLRDDKRANQEVLDYLNAENAYTEQKLHHTKDFQKKLFTEITGRLEPNTNSVPEFYKGYWYWSKYEANKDYRIHVRQKGHLNAPHELLIDQNERAKGKEYYRLGDLKVSPDQTLIAIAEDTISRRQYDIRIQKIKSKTFFPEVIKNTSGEIVWANDNKTIFYVRRHPQTLLPFQVYRHTLGTSPQKDELVYQENDASFYVDIYKTRSKKYIAIAMSATTSSEVILLDANNPNAPPIKFLAREKDHKYYIDHIDQHFYIESDFKALNKKLLRVAENKVGSRQHWQEVIPHRDDTLIQDFILFDDHIAVSERANGIEKIRIRDYQGKILEEIKLADDIYTIWFSGNPQTSSKKIRFGYSSMTTPTSILEYDIASKKQKLLKQNKIPGGFHPKNYASERVNIKARDGKSVPVSIVYRRDLFKKNSSNPLLVYAYGSYGATIDPSFSISRLSLLDRGFVFAIAHIRGGQMLGRHWYEDGKELTKMNTFTDFIDASNALIKQGYGDPKRVYAEGGSAGGLLMGAIVNMSPHTYHGVVAHVPFVDVITTMLDESIPLTTGEFEEWGNPKNKEFYDYMLAYSPYDQIKRQNYPNMLVTTGLHDSQVQYWEPAKWVAKLRDYKTDNNLLLLDVDMKAGHSGKSGRYKRYIEQAKVYAFILDLAGINE